MQLQVCNNIIADGDMNRNCSNASRFEYGRNPALLIKKHTYAISVESAQADVSARDGNECRTSPDFIEYSRLEIYVYRFPHIFYHFRFLLRWILNVKVISLRD